jgi:hypothetical protein
MKAIRVHAYHEQPVLDDVPERSELGIPAGDDDPLLVDVHGTGVERDAVRG